MVLSVLLALFAPGCGSSYPTEYQMDEESPPVRCFVATGHTVRGNFLRFFEAMDGLAWLGYPLTEPFEQEGRLVQYFEYARLEDHPDNPSGPVVKLSMLGERLGRRQPPLPASRVPPASDRQSRYYAQTGHAISGDFLTYFDENGGLDRFGFPIGEPLVVEGRLVQDFQRARLVWVADRPPGQRVSLEPIGLTYFVAQELDATMLASLPCPPGAKITP